MPIDLQRLASGHHITKQGNARQDVAATLSINDLLVASTHPLEEIECLASINDIAAAIASTIPALMENKPFSLTLRGQTPTQQQQAALDALLVTLQSLLPWFREAQTRAAITGRAWMVYDLPTLRVDASGLDTDTPLSTNNGSLPGQPVTVGPISVAAAPTPARTTGPIRDRLPLAFPLVLDPNVTQPDTEPVPITVESVISSSTHSMTQENSHLFRNRGAFSSHLREQFRVQQQLNPVGISSDRVPLKAIVPYSTVRQWALARAREMRDAARDSQQNQGAATPQTIALDLIDASHTLEFRGLGYQHRESLTEAEAALQQRDRNFRPRLESTTMQRAILPILQYESSLNQSLNRHARSESVVIRTQDVGDKRLDIARALAQTSPAGTSGGTGGGFGTLDPNQVIQRNLERIRDSLNNLGVIEIDAESEVEMMQRDLSSTADIVRVYLERVVMASGLPEEIITGIRRSGGLGNDSGERTRRQLAEHADQDWHDHWLPKLSAIAQMLGAIYPSLTASTNLIEVVTEPSYQLTADELAQLTERYANAITKLVERGILTADEARAMLREHPTLGRYFSSVAVGDISQPQPAPTPAPAPLG